MARSYNFSHVGMLHLDASGIWERTGNTVSQAYSDGSQLDFSAGTSGGGPALVWFDKPNSSNPNHYTQVTGGSGATRSGAQGAINATDHNNLIWGGYQTFTSPGWRAFTLIAGAQTTIVANTGTGIAENITCKLERSDANTIKLYRDGTLLTSVASTQFNTVPYRGIRHNANTEQNLYKLFETEADAQTIAFTTGNVSIRGNSSEPAPTIENTFTTGKVSINGHQQTFSGPVTETVQHLIGVVNLRGHTQTISYSGTEESVAKVGNVTVRGHQLDVYLEQNVDTITGKVSLNGYRHDPGGELFIDATTGRVNIFGYKHDPFEVAEISQLATAVIRVNSRGHTHVASRLWIPDTETAQTWSKP